MERKPLSVNDMRPMPGHVLLKRVDTGPEESEGGIYIVEGAREVGNKAEVVAVGPPARSKWKYWTDPPRQGDLVPMELAVGDEVLIGPYAGSEYEVDRVSHFFMKETDVMALVT